MSRKTLTVEAITMLQSVAGLRQRCYSADMKLSWVEARRIAAHATLDPRTVMAVYDGKVVTESSLFRVREAALALGMPLPIVAPAPKS
jgi:hypothetical protein